MSSAMPGSAEAPQQRRHCAGGIDALTVRSFIHTLRSHLTAIKPAAEYMAGPDVERSVREEMAAIICDAADRIEHLAADLGVLALPDRIRESDQQGAVDLADIVRRVVGRLAAQAQTMGAWLALDLDRDCPSVQGYGRALTQVVDNCLRLVLMMARCGDRVVIELRPVRCDVERPGEVDMRVHVQCADPARCCEPVQFEGVAFDAARLITEEHGGTLRSLDDRAGLLMRLPACPLTCRPAVAAAAGAGTVGIFVPRPPSHAPR
ncbi:MAG TPA: hypothetical protein VM283_09220 [Armatimonadota bacterium]|nr:hypothetical protein [Armatimonadota bacterium]